LIRIEAGAVKGTSLWSVVVPENGSFIAGGAFPALCFVPYGQRRCRIE
jgi:hypothetical protein